MAKPLFLPEVNPHSFFEKEASIGRMPDDEKNWPSHILSMLHQQLPFLSDFSVNIMIQRMEPEAGFAFGYALILSKSDPRVSTQSKNVENGIKIPIIVADRQLQPFHTFELNGEVFPLTPQRVEAAMLNPAMFDGPATKPNTTKSLVDQLYPPYQQRQGFGLTNTGTNAGGISKVSAAPEQDMTPAQLRRLATLKATEKTDAAARAMTKAEKLEDAARKSALPVAIGGALGAGKGGTDALRRSADALRKPKKGNIKARLLQTAGGAGLGALKGSGFVGGVSAVNQVVQESLRRKRDLDRKKMGIKVSSADTPSEAHIKEALVRLDFSPMKKIPSSLIFGNLGKVTVKLTPGVTAMSIHFFPVMGTKFVVGVSAALAKKLGKLTDQNEIRRALMGPMKEEIRAARGKRPSPGKFMLFVKTKGGYLYQKPTPVPGMGA